MTAAPIVLVPGFWLGGWAWDRVVELLRSDGHEVEALTLPGLDSLEADRSSISLGDHVDAICAAVASFGRPSVVTVHSGAGVPGYAASDRMPEQIAAMVYVDSGPAVAALNPDFAEVELPLPSWSELEADGSSLAGLSDEQLAVFRRRAVPQPGAGLREAIALTSDARRDVPTTMVCSSMTSEQIREAVAAGHPWVAGLAELRTVEYVDLPTGHWPMWSRPSDVAQIIGEIATRAIPS